MDCGFTSITLPLSLQSIGHMCLGMPNLTDVDMTNTNITVIPSHLFSGSYNLYEVSFPNSVSDVQYDAFEYCSVKRILYCGEYSFKQYPMSKSIDLLCDKKRVVNQYFDEESEENEKDN